MDFYFIFCNTSYTIQEWNTQIGAEFTLNPQTSSQPIQFNVEEDLKIGITVDTSDLNAAGNLIYTQATQNWQFQTSTRNEFQFNYNQNQRTVNLSSSLGSEDDRPSFVLQEGDQFLVELETKRS